METGEGSPNQDPSAQRNNLSREAIEELAFEQGPLMIDDLREMPGDSEVVDSAEFQELLSIVGWPNRKEDGSIEPTRVYDDEGFRHALLAGVSDATSLNNFPQHFAVAKAEVRAASGGVQWDPESSPINALYGAMPYLLRAYALAPELMQNLHERVRAGTHHATITLAEDSELAHDARTAYYLMGRLMKKVDEQLAFELLGWNPKDRLIEDAHKQLKS